MKDEDIRHGKKTGESPGTAAEIQDLECSRLVRGVRRVQRELTRILPALRGVRIAIQRSMAMATTMYVDERIEKL